MGHTLKARLLAGAWTLGLTAAPVMALAQETPTATADELVVTSQRAAEQKAVDAKRVADNMVETLYATDVGKLPDQNVAEALRRLPAISVANDQGEGRYVVIRGVNPNLANVTINGATAAVPEPEGRQVKLDDVPSSLIGKVEVVKSLTADRDWSDPLEVIHPLCWSEDHLDGWNDGKEAPQAGRDRRQATSG